MTKNLLAGKYQIVRELGRGGMGTVYLAYDLQIKRKVAVKLLHSTTQVAVKRFAREARAIAQLKHPNIVRVYEHVKYQDTTCMIMQYIEGMTLDKYLQTHSLHLREKVTLFLKIVNAIDYAHEKSIIHRDLKPNNILVDEQQTPYLLDFGLAKVIDGIDRSITQSGQIVGTPRYMSPEQARGEVSTLSKPSDIYSLGAIFYEIITQQPVVSKTSTIQILLEIIENPIILPRKVNSSIPISLENICLKALQKQATHRYKTAKAFADDLQRYLDNKSIAKLPLYRKYISHIFITLILLSSIAFYILQIQKQSPITISININELQEARSWLDRGLYEEAQNSFRKAYQRKLLTQQDFFIAMTTVASFTGNHNDFHSHYKRLSPSTAESLPIQLAKARMLYKDGDTEQAYSIFTSVWEKENPEQKSRAGYYLARTLLLQKKYREALTFFTVIKKINLSFIEQEHLDFFMGKCCFYLQQQEKATLYFQHEIAKEPYFAKSYFYLGKIKLAIEDYSAAEELFKKCVLLDNTNSYYFSALGKTFFAQKKYSKASENFAKAKELNHENMEAFEGFTKVAYADVRFLRGRYIQIMREIDEHRYAPPDLLRPQFISLANKYRRSYLQQQKVLHINNSTEALSRLIERLFSPDPHVVENAYNALWIMRYHPALDASFSHKKFEALKEIYAKIVIARKIEEQYSTYYQLAQLYLQPRTTINITTQILISMLHDKNEQSIFRYLAAKALLMKLEFSTIENIYKTGDNALRIICLSALKDINLTVKPLPVSIPQDPFLLSIFAKNCSWEKSAKIREFLNHEDAFISLHTANKYFADMKKECRKTLYKWMRHREVNIRANAYYFFWQLFAKYENIRFVNSTVRKLWQQGIEDEQEVQKVLLHVATVLKFSYLKSSIRQLILKTSDISIHILAIKAFSDLESPRDLIAYYANKDHMDILRAFAALKHSKNSFLAIMQYIQSDQQKGLLWLAQKAVPVQVNFLLEGSSELLKSYGYAISSMMSNNITPFIQQEKNPNMKAVLLAFLTVGTGALKNFPLLGKSQKQVSRAERIRISKKYLKHPHKNVQTAAYYTYIFIADPDTRKDVFIKISRSNNVQLKKTVAHALFYLVQNKIDAQDPTMFAKYFLTEINSQQRIWANINMAKKYFADEKQRREMKEALQQILALDSSVAEYHYYMFLLLSVEQNSEAYTHLEKACSLDKNNPIFFIEMFHIHKDTSFLEHIYKCGQGTIPEVFSSLCKESNHSIVEKILWQNYHFFAVNNQPILQEIAWKNISVFYGKKGFLDYEAR